MADNMPSPFDQNSIPAWKPSQAGSLIEPAVTPEPSSYLPLSQTLRLYAGWLLAWYGFVYLVGSLKSAGLAPWAPEFVGNLFLSPLTLYFTFATYVFLLLGTVHRLWNGGVLKGILFAVIGIAMIWGFWSLS